MYTKRIQAFIFVFFWTFLIKIPLAILAIIVSNLKNVFFIFKNIFCKKCLGIDTKNISVKHTLRETLYYIKIIFNEK